MDQNLINLLWYGSMNTEGEVAILLQYAAMRLTQLKEVAEEASLWDKGSGGPGEMARRILGEMRHNNH